MFCPNCGTQCHDNHKFCWNCGEALEPLRQEVASMPAAPIIPVIEEATEPETVPSVTEVIPAEELCQTTQVSAAEELAPVEENIINEEIPSAGEMPTITDIPAPAPVLPVKKGRIWPPILCMSIMIAVGLLLFWLIPMGSTAGDNLSGTPWFEVEDGTLYFYPEYYTGGPELTVPETVNGQTVTAIAPFCFKGNETITTVHLPETVTSIGDGAFHSCTALRGIYIHEGVTQIGASAFTLCSSLEAINLPASLGSIGKGAFSSCDSLNYIFFSGSGAQWYALYSEEINPETYVEAIDGGFTHQPTP